MKKNDMYSPDEFSIESSPSADTTNRHSLDQEIRERGYTIYSRRTGKPIIWQKRGILFIQSDVVLRERLTES